MERMAQLLQMHPGKFFVFATMLLLTFNVEMSGQHYYYAPNSVRVPVLLEKGDASLGVGYGKGRRFSAVETHGTYSPVRHGALMLNYFHAGGKDIEQGRELGTKFRFAEIGAGVYQALERGSASLFAGVGQGRLYNNYGSEHFSRFTIRRWFVQPALAYHDKAVQAGLALRLSRLSYPKGEASFDIEEGHLNTIRQIERDAPFFVPELGLSGGVVVAPVVLSLQLSFVFPDMGGLQYSRSNVNLTLTFDFNKLRTMKNKGRK